MDTKLVASNYRIQQWAEIIQDRVHSGLKVDEYCETHNITHNQYYYWLKKVREAAMANVPDQERSQSFVEITQFQNAMSSGLEIQNQLAAVISVGRCDIKISNAASQEFIEKVLGAVRNAQ